MMGKVEQLGRGGRAMVNYGRGVRRYWKRVAAKVRRRLARVLGGDAPRRTWYRGWAD